MRLKQWTLPAPVGGAVKLFRGEPIHLDLVRWKVDNDAVLRSHLRLVCCACGYTHFFTIDVWRSTTGRWWVTMIPFGEEKTRPYKVIRRKPVRRKRK